MQAFEVVDSSCLIGEDAWALTHAPHLAHRSTLSDIRRVYEDAASNGARSRSVWVLPFPSTNDGTFACANDTVRKQAALARSEGDFEACAVYGVVPGNEASIAWLRGALEADGPRCMGVKLWPYMGRFSLHALLDDRSLLDLIRCHRLVVMMHVGTGREHHTRPAFAKIAATPQDALRVVEAARDITFILGHLARLSAEVVSKARFLENCYLDTSGLSAIGRWIEGGREGLFAEDAEPFIGRSANEILTKLVSEFGLSEKLVFASMWPFCCWWGSNMTEEVGVVLHANLPGEVQRKIFVSNAERIASMQHHGVAS